MLKLKININIVDFYSCILMIIVYYYFSYVYYITFGRRITNQRKPKYGNYFVAAILHFSYFLKV